MTVAVAALDWLTAPVAERRLAQRSSFHCAAALHRLDDCNSIAASIPRAHLTYATRLYSTPTTTPLHPRRHSSALTSSFENSARCFPRHRCRCTRAHLLVMFSFAAKKVLGGATDKLKDKHDQAGGVNWYEQRGKNGRGTCAARLWRPTGCDAGANRVEEEHIQSAQQ